MWYNRFTIMYPYNWYNIRNNEPLEIILYHGNNVVKKKQVQYGFYKTNKDFVNYLSSLVKSIMLSHGIRDHEIYFELDPQHHVKLIILSDKKSIDSGENEIEKPLQYSIVMSQELWLALGFRKISSTTKVYKSIRSREPVDLDARQRLMFVYTDIIEDQVVGHKSVKLLRLLNTEGEYSRYTRVEFNPIQYIKVCKSKIQDININLKDITNSNFEFHTGQVVIKLHFKKDE